MKGNDAISSGTTSLRGSHTDDTYRVVLRAGLLACLHSRLFPSRGIKIPVDSNSVVRPTVAGAAPELAENIMLRMSMQIIA